MTAAVAAALLATATVTKISVSSCPTPLAAHLKSSECVDKCGEHVSESVFYMHEFGYDLKQVSIDSHNNGNCNDNGDDDDEFLFSTALSLFLQRKVSFILHAYSNKHEQTNTHAL